MVNNVERELYMAAFTALQKVNIMVFGTELHEDWRLALNQMKDAVTALNTSLAVPITPKLHVLTVHVEQWVEHNQEPLGILSEQALEASHHTLKRVWENYLVKDENNPVFLSQGLKAILKFNADNI